MATTNSPKWYRVSVTYLSPEQKAELIRNGWIQSSTYPERGLYKKGTGNSATVTVLYTNTNEITAENNTDPDLDALEKMVKAMKVGGRRKSNKARKSKKTRKSRKSRKSRKK